MSYLSSQVLYGRVAVFISAFCFYLATVVIRWAQTHDVILNSSFYLFARCLLGFWVFSSIFAVKRSFPRPQRFPLVLGRAVFTLSAVFCVFKAVEVTTVAEANILNMTYPLFSALFSWFLFKERRDLIAVGMVIVAFCGIVLVLSPGELQFTRQSLWGVSSGIIAGAAVIFLNLVRQHNDTETVLFFVFGIGTISLYLIFHEHVYFPNRIELICLAFSAIMGILGQYFMTLGFRYVSAVEGGIISSVRILIAALLGPYITSDAALTLSGWIGASLILGTNIYFITRKPG